jgi:1-acyl-sn-glycerol-3-phosphate acyltransferase
LIEVESSSIRHLALGQSIAAQAQKRGSRPGGKMGLADAGGRPASAGGIAATLSRIWRQLRLAVGFVQFGATALFVAFVVAPIGRLRAGDTEQAELAVQRAIHRGCALTIACLKFLGILRLDARGLAGLSALSDSAESRDGADTGTAAIIVANHPTLIDVVLLGSFLPQMDCIVNAGWTAHSPFLARAIDEAGYIRNDGGALVVASCAARLQRGRRLLVFPEGTRSPWGRFGKFHRGAAHIALASGAPVVAVTIRCRPRLLGSGRKWHDVAQRISDFEMRIAGRLDPADYRQMATPLAARKMTDDLLRIFLEEPNLADA